MVWQLRMLTAAQKLRQISRPNGSNLYDNGDVKMYSFPTVANNFSAVQNDIRSLITTQITPGTYLDVPNIAQL